MDRAVTVTSDSAAYFHCSECNYDMGPGYIECTELGVCPECGTSFTPEGRRSWPQLAVVSDNRLSNPTLSTRNTIHHYDDESESVQTIQVEQRVSGTRSYDAFDLPAGYDWSDVDDWQVIDEETVDITFTDGFEWTARLYYRNEECEGDGDWLVYETDGWRLLAEY